MESKLSERSNQLQMVENERDDLRQEIEALKEENQNLKAGLADTEVPEGMLDEDPDSPLLFRG